MNYKLIAMDIDGTLVDNERKLPPANKQALFDAMDKGMIVVLSSGRPDCGMLCLAKELELDKRGGYISAFNGSKIIDCSQGKVIYSKPLSANGLNRIYKAARDNKMALLTHDNNLSISETPEDKYVIMEAVTNKINIKKIESYEHDINFPVYKFIATAEPGHMSEVEEKVRKYLEGYYECFRSNGYFLEIVEPGVSKGESLIRLCEILDISINETIAVGDAINDISMIRAAGLGVAMDNAEPLVKASADYITASNTANGIAELLKYINI